MKNIALNMKLLYGFMVVLASIVILATVVPSIGSNIETSMPVNNTTSYYGSTTGGSLWNAGLVAITGVIGIGGVLIILNWLGIDLFGGMKS